MLDIYKKNIQERMDDLDSLELRTRNADKAEQLRKHQITEISALLKDTCQALILVIEQIQEPALKQEVYDP